MSRCISCNGSGLPKLKGSIEVDGLMLCKKCAKTVNLIIRVEK